MILRAKWLVDRHLNVHENGSVNIQEEGRRQKAEGGISPSTSNSEPAIDLGDSILMPGLVNSHCHLDYTDMRGLIPQQNDFIAWITHINQLKRSWKEADFTRSIARGLAEALQFGTTAMVNWVCFPQTVTPLAAAPMRVWWLWEQIAFRSTLDPSTWEDWPAQISSKSPHWTGGLAPHAPYTCHSEVIQNAAAWSAKRGLPWSIHVAESEDEFTMFHAARGAMFDFFQRSGRSMQDCGQTTPLASLQSRISKLESNLLLVHANCLNSSDFDLLHSALRVPRSTLSVVHCPRSHAFFGHPQFPTEELISTGINLCLGTDSLASNKDLSMFSEMMEFAKTHPNLGPRGIVSMATIHGARAIGMERDWLDWQDWIGIPSNASTSQEVWREITHFTGRPHFVMVNGQIEIEKIS